MKISRTTLMGTIAAAIGLGAVLSLRPALFATSQAAEVPLGQLEHIHGIALDPADPARLLIATHHGIYRTAPGGKTVEQVSLDQDDYMGFSPHPTDPDIVYASGHPRTGGNIGVIISRDGGRTWQYLSSGQRGPVDFHAMDVSPADPNVLYGLYEGVQISRDGGLTWDIAGTPPADVYDLSASAVDSGLVFAGTRSGVVVSRNSGLTWEAAGFQGQPASMVHAGSNGFVYAFVVGTGLVRTPSDVLDWGVVSSDFSQRVLVHLAVDPVDPHKLFSVTQHSDILFSTDGGTTWALFGAD